MKIEKRKISELIRSEYNPRKISVVQLQELKDGIDKFGLVQPLVVNENPERKNIIIGGHQRLKIWEENGNTDVDCSIVNLTLKKEKELNIRLNKNGGDWDDDLLAEYFDPNDLVEYGFEVNEVFKHIQDSIDGDDIEIDIPIQQSLQVIPKQEYIIITADRDSDEWNELQNIMKLKRVRSGGCEIGSSSDKVGMGTERVFNLIEFKKRINDYSNTK
mgnify:CR=1 FL=1|tara:strand:- start:132 stop:779 length:648 start_codon:yes stop_codon:yes gene_type:complete